MQTQEHSNAGDFRMIPLAHIIPSSTNPRRQFDAESIKSLAESIRQHGVLQPILVRQTGATSGEGAVFEIVAGERRYQAAKLAERGEIPARVETLSDEEALQVQIIENLQREDVHPLDEAQGFKHLQEVARLELSDIAQRIAKDVRYVTRRLALTNLIDEAQADFRKELITLAHALEICRLSPEIQEAALAACYERTSVWNQKEQTYAYVPDKERPARHVRHLQEWLMHNVHLNLHKAPFKLDDTRLRADGLACVSCSQRTGFNAGLFDDIKNSDTCLNPLCFKAKIQTLVNIRKTELDAKRERAAAFISPYYDTRIEGKEVLTRPQYQLLEKKAGRCQNAEQAVYADGEAVGQVKWICREPTCKDHMGRVRDTYAGATSNAGGLSATSPESRNKRKQELFDIRVDEIVRKRVMA
ncbi:MAG: ParB/RepB/Spo0J family partition protein, partial [Acidobacteriota bacterium]|nr:ParB/RepB/Spo0J family partition protein [Acidobacteriota bacterium]